MIEIPTFYSVIPLSLTVELLQNPNPTKMSKDNTKGGNNKENQLPMVQLINQMKAELMNQFKLSGESIKTKLRKVNEETNAKITTLTNTVKDNSTKIKALEEWVNKADNNDKVKELYTTVLKTPPQAEPKETQSKETHTKSKTSRLLATMITI